MAEGSPRSVGKQSFKQGAAYLFYYDIQGEHIN